MNFHIHYDVGVERLDDVLELFADTDWAHNRTRSDVSDMLNFPQAIVGLSETEDGKLIAFARALCDGHYKAIIEDVIVAESYRNKGIGHILMEALLAHPLVVSAEEFELYCDPRRLRFYSDAGFTVVEDQLFMRKINVIPEN
jgi:GNAT superfamily N-acetyltransferase